MDPTDLEDHELMLSVREGNLARLGVLSSGITAAFFGFFVKCSGDHASSEDLVQQVFYRILKYRHTYRDEGKFSTWMYHLARRVAADHFRKASAHPTHGMEPEELQDIPDRAPHAAEQASRADEIGLMRRALADIPLDQRELLALHRFQNLSHEELAELYDCSIGAMKVRVHRALNTLRERFFKLQSGGRPAVSP